MTQKSRTTRLNPIVRVDTLLLAKYGILQPSRRHEDMVVMSPSLKALTEEDKLDLFEFANFLMSDDRKWDLLLIDWPLDQDDEGIRDEP